MKACYFAAFALVFLTQSAQAESCRALADEVFDCGGAHFVRLRGTPVARARRMGELVRDGKLSGDVLRYFTDKIGDVVAEDAGWLEGPINLAYNQLVRLFHRGSPVPLAEEIDAMAAALGQDPIRLRRGLSLPDTGVLVQGLGSYPGLRFLPATGCTSVSAPLPDGGFAYGRNLDFAGVGAWDTHPMLLSIVPEEGSKELRHVVIGADGLLWGGITGVNEAGITFAVHQNYSRDISVSGVPMVLIGELVLRSAHSLDEAIEILRKNRPAVLWTFVLTDLHGTSVAVESSSHVFFVRRNTQVPFAQTNHGMHPETQASDNASFGNHANSEFRYEKALELASSAEGAGSLAKILSYQEDPLGQLSAYHDVLKSETIQTVLFESHASGVTLSLSMDPAPSSSGRYAAFPLEQFWKDEAPHFETRDYVGTPVDKRQRQRTFVNAYTRYFDDRKFAESAALLASQHTLDAALFRCVAMSDAGRFEDSLRLADEALHDNRFTAEPGYIRDSLTHVKLVSLIRLGRDEEARRLADSVIQRSEPSKQPALVEVARKLLNRESIPGWRLALHFDFFSGDLSGRKD